MSTILLKRSSTANAVPASLQVGELACNTADCKLFLGKESGVAGITDGLLDETAHDALDHTGLTGIPDAYSLPTASTTVLGGVKVDGTTVTITDGVISSNGSGITNPMTAAGDIIIGGTSGTPTRLAKGTDGQVLTLASGLPSWATGGSSASIPAGCIVRSGTTAPTGFLACDGSLLDTTTYADLYAAIGDTYSYQMNNGRPWRQQWLLNYTQSTDIQPWSTGTSLPGVLYGSQAIVTNSRVYLLGGYNSSAALSTVYTAPINLDGTLGTWTTGTSLPGGLYNSQAIVTNSRVYLLGGYVSATVVSTVYTAPINPDGTLGTWTTGTSLPGVLHASQVIVTNSRVYLLGGNNGSAVSTVYTAPINPDGTLGTWTTGTSLPGVLYGSQAIVTNSRVYLLGGYVSGAVSTVYTAPINPDGTLGTWTTGTSLPGGLYSSQAIVTNSRVYLLGGYNSNATIVSTVYTAPINPDGTLGTWTTGTSLPGVLRGSQAIVTNSRVYLLGGSNSSAAASAVSTVYTAAFSGGFNDYTGKSYIASAGTGQFRVPDTRWNDLTTPLLNSYIKA